VAAYVVRRLLWLPVTLLVVTFMTFTIARFGPGDPVSIAAGQIRDPEVLAQVRASRGLDGSLPEQYVRWLTGAIHGDFGESFIQQGYSVNELIFPKMWVSAQLGFLALVIMFSLGIPLGLLAARLNGTWVDPLIISVLLFLQAIPVIVVIPPILWLLAVQFNVLPVGGWGGVFDIWWIGGVVAIPIPDPHLYLPLLAMSLGGFAGIARLVRITALEVQSEESTVQLRHVLPNSLLPVVTVVGFALVGILEGAFFTETLLGIPGIGRFTFEAVTSRDYDVIMAITTILAAVFVLMNLAVELTYGWIDPRIRLGEARS
jgi:peptide/nickel transport system permease protein